MDNMELQQLVEEISLQFFLKPFQHKAYFNPRLRTTGGRYLLNSHHIEINRSYLEQIGREELIGIIKHELCHYHLHIEGRGYQHRDLDFRRLLQQVGAPRFCSSLPNRPTRLVSNVMKVYTCSSCSLIYRRKRAINTAKYVCGKCRGKLFQINV